MLIFENCNNLNDNKIRSLKFLVGQWQNSVFWQKGEIERTVSKETYRDIDKKSSRIFREICDLYITRTPYTYPIALLDAERYLNNIVTHQA